jgi:hypothetical protein
MQASLSTGVGTSFNYGVQVGAGGFSITGGSTINGSVYSDGPVIGNGGSRITGTVTSANSASLTSDQSNTSPTPISSCTSSTCVTFGNASASQDSAESFQVSTASPLHDIQFYLKKQGSPSNITVRIVADNAGSPGSTDLLSTDGSISASAVSSASFNWIDVTFPSSLTLYTGQTYWIILDTSTNASNYYYIGANSGGYANGSAKIGQYGGSWTATSPSGLDLYFNLYLGGAYGSIGGGSYVGALTVGTGGVGDAWGHTVQGVSVAGNMYCQVGGGSGSPYYDNDASCNTSKGDPPAIGFPVSAANIADWEDEATTSGGWTYSGNLTTNYQGTTTSTLTHITGNFSTGGGGTNTFSSGLEVDGNMTISGGSNVTVGPLLVKGNLDVQSTGMTMTGTVWVQGTVTVESGGSIKLSSSYGADGGVIISNSPVTLTGGSSLAGSGQSSSYLMIITTSNCPTASGCSSTPAISITGGSGAVIVYAPYGTISMSGGTDVNAMSSQYITISNGATVNYNSGLVNAEFSSGPTGGWNVSNWGEVQ